jgi:small subunit ribosomal protein S6
MVERYQGLVTDSGGAVHRTEDWGRRQLAHPINKVHKAHYVMLNVECGHDVIQEITGAFKFNDAVLRHLVINRKEAISVASPMSIAVEEEKQREKESQRRRDAKAAAEAAMLADSKVDKDEAEEASAEEGGEEDKPAEASAETAAEDEKPAEAPAEDAGEDEAPAEAPAEVVASADESEAAEDASGDDAADEADDSAEAKSA